MKAAKFLVALGVLAFVGLPTPAAWAGPKNHRRHSRHVRTDHRHHPQHVRKDHRHDRHLCRYVPGHFEDRIEQVLVPGAYRREFVPPVYRHIRTWYGRLVRILVRPGYTRTVWIPGHHELRTVRVWVPGVWICSRRHR